MVTKSVHIFKGICKEREDAKDRLEGLERVLQGSILGLVLLPVITCLYSLVKQVLSSHTQNTII